MGSDTSGATSAREPGRGNTQLQRAVSTHRALPGSEGPYCHLQESGTLYTKAPSWRRRGRASEELGNYVSRLLFIKLA